MNEEMFKNLSEMLGNSGVEDKFKNIFSNLSSNSSENTNNNNINSENSNNNNNFDFSNIDMATIMKIKNIMNKMNSQKDNPRSNLLMSLKPYLKPSRKAQLDKYMKFMDLTSVMEAFNNLGGDNLK